MNAINSADNEEDQSEQNLNLVLNATKSIANYCRLENVIEMTAVKVGVLMISIFSHTVLIE